MSTVELDANGMVVTTVTYLEASAPVKAANMRKYHHIGIPTTEHRAGERLVEGYATYVSGFETSEYGIEWMRFETDAPIPELVRTVPHIAFEVEDLAAEIAGKEIIIAPNSPSPGVTVAFIAENGAPVELLQFSRKEVSGCNQANRRRNKC